MAALGLSAVLALAVAGRSRYGTAARAGTRERDLGHRDAVAVTGLLGQGPAAILRRRGRLLAFVRRTDAGTRRISLRRLDQLRGHGARGQRPPRQQRPPSIRLLTDGEWIAFSYDNKMKKV